MIAPADRRALLHAGTAFFGLLLGVLPRALDLTGAALGLLAGWVVMPMTAFGRRLERPGEPYLGGLKTYPVAVAILVAVLPDARAAAAWAVFAFGDAAASLVGRRVRSARLLGHPKATWVGTGAFLAASLATGVAWGAVVAATGAPPAPGVGAVALAALAGAAADLLPLPFDDNLPIALAAGAVLAVGAWG